MPAKFLNILALSAIVFLACPFSRAIDFYQISSVAYPDRFVDLKEAELENPIIGFHSNDGRNQKWTLEKLPGKDNNYYFWTTTNKGETAYLRAKYDKNVYSEDIIIGHPDKSEPIWINISSIPDYYYIAVTDKLIGKTLCWTLNNNTEGTKITLRGFESLETQKWYIPGLNLTDS